MSRAGVAQFVAVTNASDRTAQKYLRQHSGAVDAAVNAYFASSSSTSKRATGVQVKAEKAAEKGMEKMFDAYRDAETDCIALEGVVQLFIDLQVDLDDVVTLAAASQLEQQDAKDFVITRRSFVRGCKEMGVDSMDKFQTVLPELRERMAIDDDFFKHVYSFTFRFARPEGQRAVPLGVAVDMWRLLLVDNRFQLLDPWISYLESSTSRPVQKDTWNMILDFLRYQRTDEKLEQYGPELAFPTIIDQFVDDWKLKHS